jgi:hypothetical protein
LTKFSYYLKDALNSYDARLVNHRVSGEAKIAGLVEESQDQVDADTLVCVDRYDAHVKSTERLAADLLEAYTEGQAAELAALQDNRAATEAAALALKGEAQLETIYALHVLQYAGGANNGPFGFGLGASSYAGKGNKATGVDELDLFRNPNPNGHNYAQVSSGPDQHHANLE